MNTSFICSTDRSSPSNCNCTDHPTPAYLNPWSRSCQQSSTSFSPRHWRPAFEWVPASSGRGVGVGGEWKQTRPGGGSPGCSRLGGGSGGGGRPNWAPSAGAGAAMTAERRSTRPKSTRRSRSEHVVVDIYIAVVWVLFCFCVVRLCSLDFGPIHVEWSGF